MGSPGKLDRELTGLKDQGNAAFKAGEFAAAFATYTAAINAAIDAGLVQLELESSGNSTVQLVATIYANRSACGLKLERYEQVIHDASRAMQLLVTKGCPDASSQMAIEMKDVYAKAHVRRACAFEALGNFMQAYLDFMQGGASAGDTSAVHRASVLSETFAGPVRWGARSRDLPWLRVPNAPPKRVSATMDSVVVRQLKCRLPLTCIFMRSIVWRGLIYVWGGAEAESVDAASSDSLMVVDPASDTATPVDIKPDPESRRLYGLPGHPIGRSRHAMVLWRDSIYVHGGELTMFGGKGTQGYSRDEDWLPDEARTVWRLNLKAEPLRWQRIFCRGGHPKYRHDHSAVVWNDQLVIYGGQVRGDEIGDVWSFDLVHHNWRQLMPHPFIRRLGVPAAAPEPRREHAAWVYGDWMYVWGGVSNSVQSCSGERQDDYHISAFSFPSMWRLSLTQLRWEEVLYEGNFPVARGEMGVAVNPKDGTVFLAGGYTTSCYTSSFAGARRSMMRSAYINEMFEFSSSNNYWRRVVTADIQPALGAVRAGPTACWMDGKVYVLGGYSSVNYPPIALRSILAIDIRVCAHCGVPKEGSSNGRLQQCSRCKAQGRPAVYFCSEECMGKAWPVHKIVCTNRGILP